MYTQSANQSESDTNQVVEEIEQLIVFEVDHEEYAVPIAEIREVVEIPEITPVPDSSPFVVGIINLRGKIVPVLDLEKRLNLNRESTAKSRHILIAEYDNGLIGVVVDHVKEVLKVTKNMIQPTPAMITAKVAPEFLGGVVVIATKPPTTQHANEEASQTNAEDTAQNARVLLLLELKKIITPEQLGDIQSSPAAVPAQPETAPSNEAKPAAAET